MNDATLLTAAALLTLDLVGTFVFAMSGAASGVKNRLGVRCERSCVCRRERRGNYP